MKKLHKNGFLGFGGSKQQFAEAGTYCEEILKALGKDATEDRYRAEVRKGIRDMVDGTKNSIISNRFVLDGACRGDTISRIWANRTMLVRNGMLKRKKPTKKDMLVSEVRRIFKLSDTYDIVRRLERSDLTLFLRRFNVLIYGRITARIKLEIDNLDTDQLRNIVADAIDVDQNISVSELISCFGVEALEWICENESAFTR